MMRLKLVLDCEPGTLLYFNYEYVLSSWIYSRLEAADTRFSAWLHEHGYELMDSNRRYKLFTFSEIRPTQPFKTDPTKGLIITTGRAELVLSFLLDDAMKHFVEGLFREQTIELRRRVGTVAFRVAHVEMETEPQWLPTMRFKAMTPVFVAKYVEGRRSPLHIGPKEWEGYGLEIINNLRSKALALGWSDEGEAHWRCLTPLPKAKLRQLKGDKFKAYSYDFELTAPPSLMRIGYYAGFGSKNSSLGLGFCRLL